jgi:hypothetical protein
MPGDVAALRCEDVPSNIEDLFPSSHPHDGHFVDLTSHYDMLERPELFGLSEPQSGDAPRGSRAGR